MVKSPRATTAFAWEGLYLTGTRVIQFARFVVLARLLAPQDFGLLAVAWSVVEIAQGVSDWGLDKALIQRRTISERDYNVVWTFDVLRCAGISILIQIGAPAVAALFNEPRALNLIRILGCTPILYSIGSVKRLELQRNLDFRRLTFIRLPEVVVEAAIAIVLAKALGVWSLAVAAVVSVTTTVVLSYVFAPHTPRLTPDWRAMLNLLQFGRWVFATGVAVMVGEALLRAVISRRLGTAQLGLFYLAARLAALPLSTISQIAWTVGLSLHARLQGDKGQGATAFRWVLITMCTLLLPAYALLMALAGPLTQYVLGAKWSGAAALIQVLCLGSIAAIWAGAARPVLDGRGYPQLSAVLITASQTLVIALAWVLTPRMGSGGAAWARSISDVLLFPGWLVAARIALPDAGRGALKYCLGIAVAAALGAASATAALVTFSGAVATAFAAGVGSLVALTVILALDHAFRWELTSTLHQTIRPRPAVARS
jgi:O-antigen/teichoic acid export membrane protein